MYERGKCVWTERERVTARRAIDRKKQKEMCSNNEETDKNRKEKG